MTKKNQDFQMFAGDSKDITVTMTDGSSVDGSSIKWALKKTLTSVNAVYKTTPSGITVSGTTFTVHLNASDTTSLHGRYYHEAEVTDALGNVSTVMSGTITIEPSGV